MGSSTHPWARRLPAIDGAGGLVVGLLVLGLRGFVADLHGFSVELVTFLGAANLAYSVPGLTLNAMRRRPAWLLYGLIVANLAWSVVCLVLLGTVGPSARFTGVLHLVAEGAYVAWLAILEIKHRREILADGP